MNDSTDDWEKIQFVIAIMTRDFVTAMEIGRSILAKEPSNTNIREYLTIIEKIDIDSETDSCVDTDNEDIDIITVCDKSEKDPSTENLIQGHSKISSSFKIVGPSVDIDYLSLRNSNKIDGKMYRVLPIKFCRKID
ncbi:uncharacterized protein LOC107266566 [Cephus cinctus]|uniref:Uncharacterized protein LOC107266566 n=1 Tax=Cephus cinctus TaxID=211228 RepID=A0AAJ7FHX7_CEPCN|nr:uncharacterized protein LOC107266566 [Cephus cinctus]